MSLDPTEVVPSASSSNHGSRDRHERNSSSAASSSSASASSSSSSSSGHRPLISVSEQISSLIKTLFAMQQDGRLCDVHFVLDDGTRIPAHRAVLSAGSTYFRALFASSMMEATTDEIPLPGLRSSFALRMMIEFLYTGRILNPTLSAAAGSGSIASIDDVANAMLAVLELADLYGIDPLFAACAAFLKQRITVTNCVSWLCFTAQLPRCHELHQSCLAFFCRFDSNIEFSCFSFLLAIMA